MKCEKTAFYLFFYLVSIYSFSQENLTQVDSIDQQGNKKKLSLNLDIVSRYVWRGQCWGGNYVAVQPSVEYAIIPKLTLGFWATTNFKEDYFYSDHISAYKGYHEIDLYAFYQVKDFLQIHLWDYYWPSVSKIEGIDNGYFNYGKNSSKTVDAMLCFDFSEGYRYAFNGIISTLIAGNDFRYDRNGRNPKQNFTTYVELGYTFILFENSKFKSIQEIKIDPVIGAVLNNQARYYSFADYDKVSVINLGVKITKEIDLGHGFRMPILFTYTHNAATKNTELFGKNFLVATLSLSY